MKSDDSLARENQRLKQIIQEKDKLIESLNERISAISGFTSKRISQLETHMNASPLRLNPLASPAEQTFSDEIPQRDPRHNWTPTTPTKRTPRLSVNSSNYSESIVLGSSPRKSPQKRIDNIPLLVDPDNLDTTKVTVECVIDPKVTQKKTLDPMVMLSVNYADQNTRKRLFSLGKTLGQLEDLQAQFHLSELPEKSLFAKNNPSSISERYTKITKLFEKLHANIPKDMHQAFCEFVSSDAVFEMEDPTAHTELLLKKSGRLHSNSWKPIYFKHTEGVVSIAESVTEKKPLVVNLKDCLVSLDDEVNSAFTLETRKKSGLKNRVVLCCQSTESAKSWVSELSEFTCFDFDEDVTSIKAATTPSLNSDLSTPTTPYMDEESSKKKFPTFFNKRPNQAVGVVTPFVTNLENEQFQGPVPQFQVNHYVGDSKVFGTTLKKSLESCSYEMDGVKVPSVLYRCITYLESQNAVYQEGIFRLSGVSSEISKLQNHFDTDGDCDLSEYSPDVHSVSTLLKRYLRTLEEKIFTSEVAMDLNNSGNDHQDEASRIEIAEHFKTTLQNLPEENYNFLKVLFRYLHDVLMHSQHNKMGVKNLSILFATNFQLSQETVVEILCDYEYIFGLSHEVGSYPRG